MTPFLVHFSRLELTFYVIQFTGYILEFRVKRFRATKLRHNLHRHSVTTHIFKHARYVLQIKNTFRVSDRCYKTIG